MHALHLRGVVLPEEELADLWVIGDRISREPVSNAETITRGGWLVPGLVDVHTHPGAKEPGDPLDDHVLQHDGEVQRDAGVTLIRTPGSAARLPRWFGENVDLPRVRRGGPWLATVDGFFPGWGRRETLETLPQAAVEEALESGGWCKVIADWSSGEGADRKYEPTVPPEVLSDVVRRVHAVGGRVAVHSQHRDGCEAAVLAGADSLEHGMHLELHLLDRMARQGTVLVPTMFTFSDVPESVSRNHPKSAAIRDWLLSGWDRHPKLVRSAFEAGVTVLAGTDMETGVIADEVAWLMRAGLPGHAAVGAASWVARKWLGFDGLVDGAAADIIAYEEDPRAHPDGLRHPSRIVLRGRVIR